MVIKIIKRLQYPALIMALTLAIFGVAQAAMNSNIDPQDKWAWSTNAGWFAS